MFLFSGLGQVSLDECSSKRSWGAEREDNQTGGDHLATPVGKRIPPGQRQQGCSASASAATTASATTTTASTGVSTEPGCPADCSTATTAVNLNRIWRNNLFFMKLWKKDDQSNKRNVLFSFLRKKWTIKCCYMRR